jgi:hypothetical protein
MAISSDQEFNRYSIASFDLEKALEFATEAKQHPANSFIYEALLFAAIVSYYRPFSPNEKVNNASASSLLKVEDLEALSKSEQEIHKKCKNLRNRDLAHSEFALNPTQLHPDTGVVASKPFSLLTPPFDLVAFIGLIEKLKLACQRHRAVYVHIRR